MSLASNPSAMKLKTPLGDVCSSCDLRDMFEPYININEQDWKKGTVIINVSEVLPIKEEKFDPEEDNLLTDTIWNEVIKIKKEKRSDYGSDSNFSDLNEISDDFSDFLYSDDHTGSMFSDMFKSEDSVDDEDKMIDVVSIDYNEVLPGCSSHSAQVAEMHNYSTPAHLGSHHTPLGFRNLDRRDDAGRSLKRKHLEIQAEEDNWSPSSSDGEDKVEEECHMLSSTRIVKRRIVSDASSPSRHRRGRRSLPSNVGKRKRDLSEERDYVPEQKRRKEFDDEKREQHNVLERIRRCEMSRLIQQLRMQIPSLRDDKKHSKVVILDAASAFARSESKELESLTNKEKQLDACLSKLKRVLGHEPSN